MKKIRVTWNPTGKADEISPEISARYVTRDGLLAIHRPITRSGEQNLDRKAGWHVTHVPSGRGVGHLFDTFDEAKRYVAGVQSHPEYSEWNIAGGLAQDVPQRTLDAMEPAHRAGVAAMGGGR